jgi:hypothetical protein
MMVKDASGGELEKLSINLLRFLVFKGSHWKMIK